MTTDNTTAPKKVPAKPVRTTSAPVASLPVVIAQRMTSDGIAVSFWSDGMVTGRTGTGINGAGAAKTVRERDLNVAACWLLAGEVALYAWYEMPLIVAAARKVVRSTKAPLPVFRLAANRGRWSPKASGRMDPAIARGQRQAIESAGPATAKKWRAL